MLRFGSAIACAGVVGFVLGRQSVATSPANPAVREIAGQFAASVQEPSPEVRTEVPVTDAFVRLVMKPKTFVSVLGDQPLEKQVGPSEIQ
jgi:hypothetical protein